MAALILNFRLPGQVVIAGGGRWARVVTRELVNVLPSDVPITIVTSVQEAIMHEWIGRELAGLRSASAPIVVRSDVPKCDSSRDFGIAIVANRPADHFEMATRLIKNGYNVLVEKPFTINPLQAMQLVALGKSAQRIVAAGLVFRHASYFGEFARQLPFLLSGVDQFELFWSDPAEEIRYGEVKRSPTDISLPLDVLPHAWSILDRVFVGNVKILMRLVAGPGRDSPIEIHAAIGKVTGKILLVRAAPQRMRLFRVAAGNKSASLDFSAKVAVMKIGESTPIPLLDASQFSGPLARMLCAFMAIAASGQAGAQPAIIEAGVAPLTGEKIVEHMETIAAIEREFQKRRQK